MIVIIKVKKRTGQLEDFDHQKIYRSVIAAGLSEGGADNIANQIQVWVQSAESTISTEEIKNKVIELLEGKNPEVAQTYKNYRKPE